MKKFLILIAALLAAGPLLRADTSYLFVQGPFGIGNVVETYKWKVLYEPGSLSTGLDLMNAVFGPATSTHTTYLGDELFQAGNGTLGASYIDFGSGGSSLFTVSLTVDSRTLLMDFTFDPSWNYYVAGGSGAANVPYADTVWTSAEDGLNTRTLSDGSFDGWVFGSYPGPIVDTASPGDNNPTTGNFAAATVVTVPEPGSIGFLLLGATGLLLRRRRS